MWRHQVKRLAQEARHNNFKHTCLIIALGLLGLEVPIVMDGPYWVLRDGNRMIRNHGYYLHFTHKKNIVPGPYIMWMDEHFDAVLVFEQEVLFLGLPHPLNKCYFMASM